MFKIFKFATKKRLQNGSKDHVAVYSYPQGETVGIEFLQEDSKELTNMTVHYKDIPSLVKNLEKMYNVKKEGG
jgi:hypothetical protein